MSAKQQSYRKIRSNLSMNIISAYKSLTCMLKFLCVSSNYSAYATIRINLGDGEKIHRPIGVFSGVYFSPFDQWFSGKLVN